MSEGEAAARDDSPPREVEEPAQPPMQMVDRRSASNEPADALVIHSIFYNGKPLRLLGQPPHIYGVVFKILKSICTTVNQLQVAFPEGWMETPQPSNAVIMEYTKTYNRIAKPFASNWSGSYNTDVLLDWGEPNCSARVAIGVTTYAYECAVPRPADLNTYYKSFTSETYGETNLEQMASIVHELGIGPQDVFVDLGSGIGQLVCFTAAYAKCKKCVGIELSDVPAQMGSDLGEYFKKLMNYFGKNYGKYEHIQGDFLNPKFKKLICEEATVIFINNFAFSPDLMFRIKTELLQDLKHGTRIITTKPFADIKKEITNRSVSDINAISYTWPLHSMESGVSWTARQVTFYCTKMDHTKLIKYYEDERKRKVDPNYRPEREEYETEQAATSQPPKWNEPDTDYSPPSKKQRKERHRRDRDQRDAERFREPSISTPSGKESSKKKSISVPKPAKTPKSTKHDSHRASTTASHSTPSQPKATAPPPNHQPKPPRVDAPAPDMIHGDQLDAKMRSAIQSIREAAGSSAQAAAIQDAINSVLKKSAPSNPHPTSFVMPTSYTTNQNMPPAPMPMYAPAPMAAPAPPPPPPPPPQHVMPANSEFVAEQRHTFMIPPTDPLYNIIVSYYFEFKNYYNKAKVGDPDITNQLRQDIENEKQRKNELNEATSSTNSQIDELLASGVNTLKDRLDKLGMHSVTDVTELLAGSKQIVTQHKGLTSSVANMENNVALEEQKLRLLCGPEAVKHYNISAALYTSGYDDIERTKEIVISSRPPNFVAQLLPEGSPNTDSKISPSGRRPRQPRPRQPTANGARRGHSGGRKSDGPTEEVEMEIRQFVKHALQVDNAVKEKERKARGTFLPTTERIS